MDADQQEGTEAATEAGLSEQQRKAGLARRESSPEPLDAIPMAAGHRAKRRDEARLRSGEV